MATASMLVGEVSLQAMKAMFALAQAVIDPRADALVICPNPFYQIYEGAALLAGATPWFVNSDPARNFSLLAARLIEITSRCR